MSLKMTTKGIICFTVASGLIPWSIWITGEVNAGKLREIVAHAYVDNEIKEVNTKLKEYEIEQLKSQNARDILLAEMAKDIKLLLDKE